MESTSIFNVCRLCLFKSERLINIFEANGRHGYIAAEVITDLLQFKVFRTDGYPHFVCCPCLDKLTDFKIFKDQCVNSKITYDSEFSQKKEQQYFPDSVSCTPIKVKQDEKGFKDESSNKANFVPVPIKQEVESSDEEDTDSQMATVKGAEDLSVVRGTDEDFMDGINKVSSEITIKHIKMEEDEDDIDTNSSEMPVEDDASGSQHLPIRKEVEGERIEVCPEVSHLTGHLTDENESRCDMDVMDLRKPRVGAEEDPTNLIDQPFERANTFRNPSEGVGTSNNCDESFIRGHHLAQSQNTYGAENLSGKSYETASQPTSQRSEEDGGSSDQGNNSQASQEDYYRRERPFECEQCGWRFVNTAQLEKHQQIHSTDKPFECEECGWRFFNRGQLTRHQKSHNGEKPFICEICGKRFVRKSSLVTHHRIHTGEKPFSCGECGSSFAQSGDLAKHMRIHSGEKPFPCHECGKTFAQSSDLAKHFRVHSGEKPYACDECDRRFASTCDLNRHKMGHSGDKPFECEMCEKRFIRRSALVIHVRTHTGEKPYSCPECGKGFPQRSGLATHLRVHSGERPYPCSECDKRFNTSGDLKRHMNVHAK